MNLNSDQCWEQGMFGSVVLQNGIVLPASSSTQDVTVRREMCSVSVSHSKVLLFLVVD